MPERDVTPQSDQLAKAGRNEDLRGGGADGPRLSSMEASPPTLLPTVDAGQHGPSQKWMAPLVGLLVLTFVGWLAMGRMDQESEGSATQNAPFKGIDTGQAPAASAPSPAPTATPPGVGPAPGSKQSAGPGPTVGIMSQAESAMHEWVKLWRARQAQPYSALYDPQFVGLDRHLSARQQRMTQAAFIEVEISELQSRETGPGEVTVRFRQIYRSNNYQSDDRKEIVWRQTPQGLKIIAERLVN